MMGSSRQNDDNSTPDVSEKSRVSGNFALERMGPPETPPPAEPEKALPPPEHAEPPTEGLSPLRQFVGWMLISIGLGLGILLLYLASSGHLGPKPLADVSISAGDPAIVRVLPEGTIDLVFAGEIMLGRNVAESVRARPEGFRFPFLASAPLFNAADLAFCTLSAPISDAGTPIDEAYRFRAPTAALEGLAYAGFDGIALANRHTLDYGPAALQDMEAQLSAAGMASAGLAEGEASQVPALFTVEGVRVGMLAYCDPASPGACAQAFDPFPRKPAKGTRAIIAADVAALAAQVDIVVVSMHWGPDYEPEITDQQRSLGHFIIDAGADVVMGHGPHVLQPAETYHGGVILYSLGNFIFDQYSKPGVLDSRIYRVTATQGGVQGAGYIPLESLRNEWQPVPKQDVYSPIMATKAPVAAPLVAPVRLELHSFFDYLVHAHWPFHYILPGIAIALIILYVFIGWWRLSFLRGVLMAVLLVTAVFAVWNYTEDHYLQGRYFNGYEFYHYYLGAKYADEVGYDNLYNAVFVADEEAGYRTSGRTVRSLEDHRIVSGQTVLREKEQYKALFTPERWEEFKRDVAFFRSKVSASLWNRMLNDKGYNATPIWTMVAGTIANRVPTSDWAGMLRLPLIDVALALVTLALVWWAFGARAMLLMIVFVGGHYLTSHFTLKAAFMRLDWVLCVVMCLCFLRKGWYAAAGLALAYATGARIFPLIFGFGMGAKMVWGFLRTWRLEWKYVRFFAAFAGGLVVLFLASLWYGGVEPWRQFLDKIALHDSDISGWRVGFKYVFLVSWEGGSYWDMPLAQAFDAHKTLWWSIQAAVILLSFLCVKKLRDDEALAFGYVLVFFLVAPTYYYHVMLVVPLLFFAARLENPAYALGLVFLFATGIVGHYYFAQWNRGFNLFFVISCMLQVLVLYMMLIAFVRLFMKEEEMSTPTTGTAVG